MPTKIKKSGRPKIENPRSKQYRVRLTAEEFEKLEYLAIQNGRTMSDILRKGIEIQYENSEDVWDYGLSNK